MCKLDMFKIVEFEGFFFVVGKECRTFDGKVEDYMWEENPEYINCCFLTHKTDKQLSGLIR